MASAVRFPRSEEIVFDQRGDFVATHAAERALKAAGFSVGRMQKGAPRGLILGDVEIMKWRNLTHVQRQMCDAEMHGGRTGPVVIVPSAVADDDVLAALEKVRAAAEIEPARLTMVVGGFAVDA